MSKHDPPRRGEPLLPMWTVYESPADRPGLFVARMWLIGPLAMLATDKVVVGDTLAEVRSKLPPMLARVPRSDGDDACIVETWI
jgi:hypothetical protein